MVHRNKKRIAEKKRARSEARAKGDTHTSPLTSPHPTTQIYKKNREIQSSVISEHKQSQTSHVSKSTLT
jgi:hypothetical protein